MPSGLYHCFSLSLRDVELILAARGIVVSYESIREWGLRFGRIFANMLRQRRPQPGDKWYMCARPGRKCPRHPGPEPAQRDRSQAVLSQAAEGLAIRSAGDRDRQVQELRRRPARDPAEHRRARLMRNMPMARLLRWVSPSAVAGAAIASSSPPTYYASPPTYSPLDAPPVYSAVLAPVYSYVPPPPAYYPPVPYNAPGFYYSGY